MDEDKEDVPIKEEPKQAPVENPKNLAISGLNDEDLARIIYFERLSGKDYNQMLKGNLTELMNMGFIDFERNLKLLELNHNNLEVVCSKILE
jgi:predicted transcriptional regulator